MDIIILLVLLLTAGLMLARAPRNAVLAAWLVSACLIAGLFNQHATSILPLSF